VIERSIQYTSKGGSCGSGTGDQGGPNIKIDEIFSIGKGKVTADSKTFGEPALKKKRENCREKNVGVKKKKKRKCWKKCNRPGAKVSKKNSPISRKGKL